MINHATTEVFFDRLEIPAENLLGEEGRGFRYILDGMNAERILIAAGMHRGLALVHRQGALAMRASASCSGGRSARTRASSSRSRGPMPKSQAARLMVYHAAQLYEGGLPCGAEANMAKLLASEASWHAADACLQTHGGFGFAEEYDVERKFRETRLYQVAPISTNLILAYLGEHVLGMPRSYLTTAASRTPEEAMDQQAASSADDAERLSGLTDAVARFVAALRFEQLGPEVLRISRRCILDGLAVMLAGSEQPGMAPLARHLLRIGGAPNSRLVGDAATRLPAPAAALWNGTAGHAMDWDDTQLAEGPGRPYGLLMHPTVPPLAAALAVSDLAASERGQPVNGREFLTAFNAGFEVGCKIAEAIKPDHYMRGSTLPARSARSPPPQRPPSCSAWTSRTAQAIGIAASMASGIRANFGTMTKPLHVGRAAENGVTAALLAREGFSADPRRSTGNGAISPSPGRAASRRLVRDRLGRAVHDREPRRLDQALSVRRADASQHGRDALPHARRTA